MLEHHMGELLVKIARQSFESSLRLETPKPAGEVPYDLHEKRGVFVRVRRSANRSWSESEHMETLACLGYAFPSRNISEAVIDAAAACAVRATSSTRLRVGEMQNLFFEVSVLSEPEFLQVEKPAEYPKKLDARRDGLIVEYGFANGLILTQISIENKYDEIDLLCECSLRAGLSSSSWLTLPGIRVYKFQAEIFRETESGGTVIKFAP
jgi:uncharacterized protein (TIGR00296 family)